MRMVVWECKSELINLLSPPSFVSSERKHGFSAEPVPVSAYVGSSKDLKDLKDNS
jgi:hypothetical protein